MHALYGTILNKNAFLNTSLKFLCDTQTLLKFNSGRPLLHTEDIFPTRQPLEFSLNMR